MFVIKQFKIKANNINNNDYVNLLFRKSLLFNYGAKSYKEGEI